MPTVSFKSKIQATSESCSLVLLVRHRLLVGQQSEIVYVKKMGLPDGIRVLLAPQLVITISGMLNGERISPGNLQNSCVAHHLLEYFRLHAEELGVHVSSDPCVSESTGQFTFSCKGSRPLSMPTGFLHGPGAELSGFDVNFIWEIKSCDDPQQNNLINASIHPFSRQLSLSYLTLVNIVVEKFVKFHVVRRYPFIFGAWSKQLDTERNIFNPIYSAIDRMVARSPRSEFRNTCAKLLKCCAMSNKAAATRTVMQLSEYFGDPIPDRYPDECEDNTNDHKAFLSSMERIYISGLRRPLFRGFPRLRIRDNEEMDALLDEPTNLDGLHRTSPSNATALLKGPTYDELCHEDIELEYLNLDYMPGECRAISCQSDLSFNGSSVDREDNCSVSPALSDDSNPELLCADELENGELQEALPSFSDCSSYSQLTSEDWFRGQHSIGGPTPAKNDVPIGWKLPLEPIDTWSPDVIPASQGNRNWPSMGRELSLTHTELQSHDFKGAAFEAPVQHNNIECQLDIEMEFEDDGDAQTFQRRQDEGVNTSRPYEQPRLVSGFGSKSLHDHGFEAFDLDFTDSGESDFDSWADDCFAEDKS